MILRPARLCAGLFAAAVISRAAFLVFVTGIETPLMGDAADYHRHAAHLAETLTI